MKALQHLALNCANLKKQEQFYSRHFGFRRARVFNANTPDEFVLLRLGPMCLELFQAPAEHTSLVAKAQPVGFQHFAFAVSDLEATLAALHADGLPTDNIIDCGAIVPGMRICFFHDPEGNRIELVQGYKDEFTE